MVTFRNFSFLDFLDSYSYSFTGPIFHAISVSAL
jgi:hypothetical protein